MTKTAVNPKELLTPPKGVKVGLEYISPDQAAEYINNNNRANRKIKENTIKILVKDMTGGKWKLNGESIVFDSNGVLKDGQHRLVAGVRANFGFYAVVVRGVDPDVMDTIDTGINRTLSDVLYLEGFQYATDLASICKRAIKFNLSLSLDSWSKEGVTNATGYRYVVKHQNRLLEYSKIASRYATKSQNTFPKSEISLVLHIITKGKTPTNEHLEFIKHFVGVVREENSAFTWYINLILKARAEKVYFSTYWKVGIIIKIWNHFLGGNPPVKYIKFDQSKPLPKVK